MNKRSNREKQVDHVVELLDLLPDLFRKKGKEPPTDQQEFFSFVMKTPNEELEEMLQERIMEGVKPFRYSAMVKLFANGSFDPTQDLRHGATLETIRLLNQERVEDAKDSVIKWSKALENWDAIFGN